MVTEKELDSNQGPNVLLMVTALAVYALVTIPLALNKYEDGKKIIALIGWTVFYVFVLWLMAAGRKKKRLLEEQFRLEAAKKQEEKIKAASMEMKKIEEKLLSGIETGFLNPFFERYITLTQKPLATTKKYTNSQFSEFSREFLSYYYRYESFLKTLSRGLYRMSKRKDSCLMNIPEDIFLGKSRYSMARFVENHSKGRKGELSVRKTLIKDEIGFYESVNMQSDDTQIETDFIIVKGNNIVLLEVKDYAAEKIVFDSSGEIYRVFRDRAEPVENVLSQVNRHKKFIKKNFPENVVVTTLIVLSDKNSVVVNNMDSDRLKVVVPDYISNVIEEMDGKDQEAEEVIRSRIQELRANERYFNFFDIEREIEEFRKLMGEIDSPLIVFKNLYMSGVDTFEESMVNQHQKLYLAQENGSEMTAFSTKDFIKAHTNYREYGRAFNYKP